MSHKTKTAAPKKHCFTSLVASMKDPLLKVKEDDSIVIIKDKYPKAKFHYLILPKKNINTIWNVSKEHKNLLSHMDNMAEELSKEHPECEFIIGYHALPSMQRLHLHVISTDFNSECLKKKVHWNSFTTPFFLRSKEILKQLKEKGEIERVDAAVWREHLNTELKCFKCTFKPKNMGVLKRHLLSHLTENNKINNFVVK